MTEFDPHRPVTNDRSPVANLQLVMACAHAGQVHGADRHEQAST
jgi:hypothetical protein